VKPPRLEERRIPEFSAELRELARAWIPSWGLADGERDFGRAVLEVAARFSSEVAERFDRAGEKMQRGFLDWLAVRGEAARPARMPVVFKLADTARTPVPAPAPVSLQADVNGVNFVFETESEVRLIPGRLEVVVGVDADADAFYLPPPALSDLEPVEPLPAEWRLKSFAAVGAKKLQLDPEAGLVAGIVIEAARQQYRIEAVDKEIVTIDPPLTAGLDVGTVARKVTAFAPFDGKTRNRQEHALYIGHKDLLDITAPAKIAITGAQSLRTGVTWEYWGKVEGKEEVDWQPLTLVQPQPPGAVLLSKDKGAIEMLPINGKTSRWIRALTKNIPPGQQPQALEDLRIRINPVGCDKDIECRDDKGESPAAEGMANTTPLVLEKTFLPLGREPRQFDAFYLASAEAFSKPGAKVQLCFDIADLSFESLAVQRSGPYANQILVGVAKDGYLHLLGFNATNGTLSRYDNRDPLRPPSPRKNGEVLAEPPIALDGPPNAQYRAALWTEGLLNASLVVAVAAGSTIWAWRQVLIAPALSGWENLGAVEDGVQDPTARIAGIVYLAGHLYALRERKLFVRDLNAANAAWQPVTTESAGNPIELETIVPVQVEDGSGLGPGTLTEGLVGVDNQKALYTVTFPVDPTAGVCTKLNLSDDVAKGIAPAAVRRLGGELCVVAVDDAQTKLLGYRSAPTSTPELVLDAIPIGHSVDVILSANELTYALTARIDGQSTALAQWMPFVQPDVLFATTISPGAADGAPTQLPAHVVVPAKSNQVLVAGFNPNGRQTFHTDLHTALIASDPADRLALGDIVAIPVDPMGTYQSGTITGPGVPRDTETLYEFDFQSEKGTVFLYRVTAPTISATVNTLTNITIDTTVDPTTGDGTVLMITTTLSTAPYTVSNFDPMTGDADLDPALDAMSVKVNYKVPETSNLLHVPLLHLDPLTNGNWQASLLARTYLIFPGADPARQHGDAWQTEAGTGKPLLVALERHWDTDPPITGLGTEFVVDGSIGDWAGQLVDTSASPELSWEYGNGTGWSALVTARDDTQNFKRSGAVRFVIPADLRPTDWAGKTNYWIRARLVGGDYGKETATVTTKPTNNPGETQQTITRSSVGVRAPSVVALHISYRLCTGVLPSFVMTRDSGSFRDQSDANRTRGAIVEAFVSLAFAVGQLSNPAPPSAEKKKDECPPPCECSPAAANEHAAADAAPVVVSTPATGRMMFIGLKATPSGAPVKVLLLVERERKHEQFAPMRIDALVANRFVPIVAEDETRALGESGLLSMSFALEPTLRELFGVDDLTWLRLTPVGAPITDWQPAIRGAYLNAVWASAQETLTRELLGSSEGAPNLTVFLARPPVLEGTLELRVKEPLGDEERKLLRDGDENRVLSDVVGLRGDWVLWRKVMDPLDEPANERVYALDESNGEIRFGDGQHGMIPPIGVDSIVAFRYRRTEAVPANDIAPRTALNLVSPVESVEAVFAADQSAGGAPPESDERVLRFGTARLRHRNRAVTASDFEDLALESSPDIKQARCFVRPGDVRLVVVMRGENPIPNAAQVRELRRHLLPSALASLAVPGALAITGPRIRRLRIVLELSVASLDFAGDVSRAIEKQIRALFDAWPLGENPAESDIALKVIDTANLESLGDVKFYQVFPDRSAGPWTGAIQRDELVMLDKDAVRLEFKTSEVVS
jgi:hypothetical protein